MHHDSSAMLSDLWLLPSFSHYFFTFENQTGQIIFLLPHKSGIKIIRCHRLHVINVHVYDLSTESQSVMRINYNMTIPRPLEKKEREKDETSGMDVARIPWRHEAEGL